METMEMYEMLWQGFGTNLIITCLAAMIPLAVGALLTFLANLGKVPATIFRWLSLPTEALCPLLLVLCLSYIPTLLLHTPFRMRDIVVILGLAISFIGYMPARYVSGMSLAKNLVCNGLDLISQLLKWSCVARMLGVADIAMAAEHAVARGSVGPMIVALLVFAAVLTVPEVAKRLCQTFMK